jgi:protein SCO1/2
MRTHVLRSAMLALVPLAVCTSLGLAGPRLDPAAALEKSEAAIGSIVGGHLLTGSDGLPLDVRVFRGRPLVVSLVYTSCNSVCPTTTQNLKRAVARARKALGDGSFTVLTIGFDARNDTPGRLAAFASDQDIDGDPLWRVASASPATLGALLQEVGFSYAGAAGGFEHVAQTTIIDADGRVYRQVYGDEFPLQMLVEPLKALVFGVTTRSFTPAALADRLRFLCTVYDPETGRYRTDYAIYIGIFTGGLSLILMAWVILRMWRGNRRLEEACGGRQP